MDAGRLTAIARAAKAHWGYPTRWLEEWRDLLTITPGFIAAKATFAAVLHGRIVGFYALQREGGELRLEHFLGCAR